MSTRCQVKVVDDRGDEQWFYRHSDGYPEGVMPTLNKFLSWVKEGRIRDNVEQACGWLVIIGHEEYAEYRQSKNLCEPGPKGSISGWKVGAYEPCPPVAHGDIEHFYVVDLAKLEIREEKIPE